MKESEGKAEMSLKFWNDTWCRSWRQGLEEGQEMVAVGSVIVTRKGVMH